MNPSEEMQPVLRCHQCNKPFDKPAALKRHGYYCRSRKLGAHSRSRACQACARSKARCDNKRPECSRCVAKTIPCQYPPSTGTTPDTLPRVQHDDDTSIHSRDQVSSMLSDAAGARDPQESNYDGDISGHMMVVSSSTLPDITAENLDWNPPEVDFVDLWDPQISEETIQYLSSGPSTSIYESTPSTIQIMDQNQFAPSPFISVPPVPVDNVRAIVQRPKLNMGIQRNAQLMLHALKSFPQMMMHHNTLPPFIHPLSLSFGADNDDMEPLNNCINLVYMTSGKHRGSQKLFWRNVRLECERFIAEQLSMNKWELLAAIQALLVYVLTRIDEGETEHNNFDFLMLSAVKAVAHRINNIESRNAGSPGDRDLETKWKEWIWEESARRICVVYQAINLLVYFEPAAMCEMHSDLVLAPLPAKKQLWEAPDEIIWKMETEKDPGSGFAYALTADGDLVKLETGQANCVDDNSVHHGSDAWDIKTSARSNADWADWCSGMDGFGGLVMLAASLA